MGAWGWRRTLRWRTSILSAALTSSIPAKAGISLFAEAGRATLAPLRFVICAGGAGIGRFPLSREWKGGAGMGRVLIWEIPDFRGNGEGFWFGGLGMAADSSLAHFHFIPALSPPPIPAKAGISLLAEAGRATLAPLCFVICADGAGIGRFPLSREWKGGGREWGCF